MQTIPYEPHIDGLRALAVVSVIAAHAGIGAVPGGFVGVDIFFVISGYLITQVIRQELAAGTFSLTFFYARRARRIIPALFLVILACLPLAWHWMNPNYLKNFGQSVVASALFMNNILLAKTSGYWDLESEFKPLLHTWSLAVEVQIYLLFPFLMLGLRRAGDIGLALALAALAGLSFACFWLGARLSPEVSFYLPTSRFWEFLVGSLCAMVPARMRTGAGAGPFALVGVMPITAALLLAPRVASPLAVVSAVGGTALLILFAHARTLAGRLLGSRPAVAVGLMSYSLYLWHQPLLAFARLRSAEPPGAAFLALLAVALLPLSYLSWSFVERPWRRGAAVPAWARVPAGLVLGLGFVVAGVALHLTRGAPSRLYPGADSGELHITYNERIRSYATDTFGRDGRVKLLVVGNSLARDIANSVVESGFADGKSLVYREDTAQFCGRTGPADTPARLFDEADYVLLAGVPPRCAVRLVARAESCAKKILVFGPKHFGYNLNILIDVEPSQRPQIRVRPDRDTFALNEEYHRLVPPGRYFDMINTLGGDGRTLPAFDGRGMPLSQDRIHFTRYGAIYAAPAVAAALGRLRADAATPASSALAMAEAEKCRPRR